MEVIPESLEKLAKTEVLGAFIALLPGFITAAIVRSLTVPVRKSTVERVIEALIYTFLIQATWPLIVLLNNLYLSHGGRVQFGSNGPWKPTPSETILGLAGCAFLWGILMTLVINTGFLHSLLRGIRLTRRSSRPSEWYEVFSTRSAQRYVVVHLRDRRRVFGWVKLWPEQPRTGDLFLMDAQWLSKDGPIGTKREILIRASDVRLVEFVPLKPASNDVAAKEAAENHVIAKTAAKNHVAGTHQVDGGGAHGTP
jgi:hypothetical protein